MYNGAEKSASIAGLIIWIVILSLIMGRIVDNAGHQYRGLLIVFGIAFLTAIVEVIILVSIPQTPAGEPLKVKYRLDDIIRTPMKKQTVFSICSLCIPSNYHLLGYGSILAVMVRRIIHFPKNDCCNQ